jgi:hypothetical protein
MSVDPGSRDAKLIAARARLADIERKIAAPSINPDELTKDFAALKSGLGLDDSAGKQSGGTVDAASRGGAAGAEESPALSSSVPPTLSPEKAASEIVGMAHSETAAKTFVKAAQIEGFEFIEKDGGTAMKKGDSVLTLSEGFVALGLEALAKPKGAPGSGGRGGFGPIFPRAPQGTLRDQWAASGYSADFYNKNREGLIRERYGRLPLK